MKTATRFEAQLKRFSTKGEKTGWTYVEIPEAAATQLKPGQKTAYRVKGTIDAHPIRQVSLVPMGNGCFILAVNSTLRKAIRKTEGARVVMELEVDEAELAPPADFIACLEDEPAAGTFYQSLAPSHQRYFINWIEGAKTAVTRDKRMAQAVSGLAAGQDYGTLIRSLKAKRTE